MLLDYSTYQRERNMLYTRESQTVNGFPLQY